MRQIGRHDCRCPAKESKGRLHHSSEANGNELRQPALVRFDQELDGISAAFEGLPPGLILARNLVTESFAPMTTLVEREIWQKVARLAVSPRTPVTVRFVHFSDRVVRNETLALLGTLPRCGTHPAVARAPKL